jgi:hypothetical protein
VETASSISGNHPFLGPVNFISDASHPPIGAFCFSHSQTLLSSTPKITVALRCHSSLAYRTLCLNFATVCDSLLDFWCPSSTTDIYECFKTSGVEGDAEVHHLLFHSYCSCRLLASSQLLMAATLTFLRDRN